MTSRLGIAGAAGALLLTLGATVAMAGDGPEATVGDCIEERAAIADQDRLQLRVSAPVDRVLRSIPEIDDVAVPVNGEPDQDRTRAQDGSCGEDCDGEPDQDRTRLRVSAPVAPIPAVDAARTREQEQAETRTLVQERERTQEQERERTQEQERERTQEQEREQTQAGQQEQTQAGPGSGNASGSGRGG